VCGKNVFVNFFRNFSTDLPRRDGSFNCGIFVRRRCHCQSIKPFLRIRRLLTTPKNLIWHVKDVPLVLGCTADAISQFVHKFDIFFGLGLFLIWMQFVAALPTSETVGGNVGETSSAEVTAQPKFNLQQGS